MAGLNADRNTTRKSGERFARPVEAATVCYAGGIVCLNAAGNAVPGSTSTSLKADGVARSRADNSTGSAGAITVESYPGVYHFANSSAGDAIAQADIGNNAYIVDDQTVAKTSGSNTRSVAGQIRDVDATGVWVAIGAPPFPVL